MNRIEAVVSDILEHEGVCRILFDAGGHTLAMVGLEPPAGLAKGAKAVLGVKATHILLALKPPRNTTLANALPVTVESIETGKVMATVSLRFGDTPLEAILSAAALRPLKLQEGDSAWALFMESELAVLEMKP